MLDNASTRFLMVVESMATMTAAEMVRAAFERARGRSALVHWLDFDAEGAGTYAVGSSTDVEVAYTVRVLDGAFFCDCPSAARPACWHRAAVAQLRASRAGFGLEADGPSAAQERSAERAAARGRMAEISRIFAA
jgi:hypothetical protein